MREQSTVAFPEIFSASLHSALQHPDAPQRLPIDFPVASRPIGACRRSLRSALIGGDGAAIRFEALFENVLVSTEARRDEEMLLRLGK